MLGALPSLAVTCPTNAANSLEGPPPRPTLKGMSDFPIAVRRESQFRVEMPPVAKARFSIGEIVRHRMFDFRGVVFDIDPVFANSDEWYESIPEAIRPRRDQPFYHLLAENDDSSYLAYVSQANLLADAEGGPVDHPTVRQLFDSFKDGRYRMRRSLTH